MVGRSIEKVWTMDIVKWFLASMVGWETDVIEIQLQRGTKNRWMAGMEIKDHFLAYYWHQRD